MTIFFILNNDKRFMEMTENIVLTAESLSVNDKPYLLSDIKLLNIAYQSGKDINEEQFKSLRKYLELT